MGVMTMMWTMVILTSVMVENAHLSSIFPYLMPTMIQGILRWWFVDQQVLSLLKPLLLVLLAQMDWVWKRQALEQEHQRIPELYLRSEEVNSDVAFP